MRKDQGEQQVAHTQGFLNKQEMRTQNSVQAAMNTKLKSGTPLHLHWSVMNTWLHGQTKTVAAGYILAVSLVAGVHHKPAVQLQVLAHAELQLLDIGWTLVSHD